MRVVRYKNPLTADDQEIGQLSRFKFVQVIRDLFERVSEDYEVVYDVLRIIRNRGLIQALIIRNRTHALSAKLSATITGLQQELETVKQDIKQAALEDSPIGALKQKRDKLKGRIAASAEVHHDLTRLVQVPIDEDGDTDATKALFCTIQAEATKPKPAAKPTTVHTGKGVGFQSPVGHQAGKEYFEQVTPALEELPTKSKPRKGTLICRNSIWTCEVRCDVGSITVKRDKKKEAEDWADAAVALLEAEDNDELWPFDIHCMFNTVENSEGITDQFKWNVWVQGINATGKDKEGCSSTSASAIQDAKAAAEIITQENIDSYMSG